MFYDFNEPESVPQQLLGSFEMLVIDPPYITREVRSCSMGGRQWRLEVSVLRLVWCLVSGGVSGDSKYQCYDWSGVLCLVAGVWCLVGLSGRAQGRWLTDGWLLTLHARCGPNTQRLRSCFSDQTAKFC